MSPRQRSLLRAGFGIAVSLLAIGILVTAVPVDQAIAVLLTADPRWIALMLGTVILDIAFRAARWRALLAPIRPVPYRRMLGYTYIGYLANNILPARLGELVRSHAAGEGEGLPRPTVLGTVVVERVIDTIIVVGLAALAVVILSVRGTVASGLLLGGALVVLLVVTLAIGIALHRVPGMDRLATLVGRSPRVLDAARRLREGLAVASRPATLVRAIGFSILAWTASTITTLAGAQAVGVELTVAQGLLLNSGVALATIVPSAPGYLGTFELTAVGILSTFGVAEERGFAAALLIHAMILAVTSVGGAIAAIRMGVGLGTGPVTMAPAAPVDDARESTTR